MNVMGSLSDATKFESWLKAQKEFAAKTITKEKNYSYVLAENNTALSWTDKNVMITIYNHTQMAGSVPYDTVKMEFKIPEKKNVEADLKKEVNTYYTQEKDASMAGVAAFTNNV